MWYTFSNYLNCSTLDKNKSLDNFSNDISKHEMDIWGGSPIYKQLGQPSAARRSTTF